MIKDYLCPSPILAMYDNGKPVFIETDALYKRIGAIVKQPATNSILHPVAFFSRKLSKNLENLRTKTRTNEILGDLVHFFISVHF